MPKVILNTKLYTLKEVRELLNVTRTAVSLYISKGRMQATVIGGRKYVSEDNLREFVQGGR